MDLKSQCNKKWSEIGPAIIAGNSERTFIMMIRIKRNTPKVNPSLLRVPTDRGVYVFSINIPDIHNAPIKGINLPKSIAKAVVKFQKIVLSPNPSNPEPFPAEEEIYS